MDILLEDQEMLRAHGLSPILDCIQAYPREEEPEAVRTAAPVKVVVALASRVWFSRAAVAARRGTGPKGPRTRRFRPKA